MAKITLNFVLVLSIFSSFCCGQARAQATQSVDKTKVFLTTSTYGVMAGSLVGLASLTFYNQPSKHLRNVAMGASIGLYTGLLLGAYMIYFVPDPSKPQAPAPVAPAPEQPSGLDSDDPLDLAQPPQGGGQSEYAIPAFTPIAFYDGKAFHLGLDYRF